MKLEELPGIKQRELKPCLGCGKGVAHCQSLTFYRFSVESFVINPGAVRRQTGLEQMMGNAALAAVMGPDEDLAKQANKCDGLLCLQCAFSLPLTSVLEAADAQATGSQEANNA